MKHVQVKMLGLAVALLLGVAPIVPPVQQEVQGIIGRPLTPLSYAGVARRTTRRAVYAGAAVAAPYPYYRYPYW
jgi:hypothetical protein